GVGDYNVRRGRRINPREARVVPVGDQYRCKRLIAREGLARSAEICTIESSFERYTIRECRYRRDVIDDDDPTEMRLIWIRHARIESRFLFTGHGEVIDHRNVRVAVFGLANATLADMRADRNATWK